MAIPLPWLDETALEAFSPTSMYHDRSLTAADSLESQEMSSSIHMLNLLLQNGEKAKETSVTQSVQHIDVSKDSDETSNSKSADLKLGKILEIFDRARKDFHEADAETPDYITAARFLRDTAENCIHFLETQGVQIVTEKLTEIRSQFAEATVAAEKSLGGKRRRFDYDYIGVPEEPRRNRLKNLQKKVERGSKSFKVVKHGHRN